MARRQKPDWTPAPKKALGRLSETFVGFGVFDFGFYCVIGPYADLPAYAAHRHNDPSIATDPWEAEPRGAYVNDGAHAPIVWMPRYPRTAREYGTLAHEILHVLRCFGEWGGIKLTRESDEVFCHALGYGITKVLDELRPSR
jgi:hypothetical protein